MKLKEHSRTPKFLLLNSTVRLLSYVWSFLNASSHCTNWITDGSEISSICQSYLLLTSYHLSYVVILYPILSVVTPVAFIYVKILTHLFFFGNVVTSLFMLLLIFCIRETLGGCRVFLVSSHPALLPTYPSCYITLSVGLKMPLLSLLDKFSDSSLRFLIWNLPHSPNLPFPLIHFQLAFFQWFSDAHGPSPSWTLLFSLSP